MYLNIKKIMNVMHLTGLTVTWDVFEYSGGGLVTAGQEMFNRNMGCIWMSYFSGGIPLGILFNRNMGCIWMIAVGNAYVNANGV